jgi:pimeloyl-ACP methyl ester carboxylesterase
VGRYEDRQYNSTDGLRLHYRDYAGGDPDQPPILCLPGLTRNARDFEPVADRFAGDWRVLALDFRGAGGSAPDPEPARYMPATYARDVIKLLDQLGHRRCGFCRHVAGRPGHHADRGDGK